MYNFFHMCEALYIHNYIGGLNLYNGVWVNLFGKTKNVMLLILFGIQNIMFFSYLKDSDAKEMTRIQSFSKLIFWRNFFPTQLLKG